MRIPPGTLRERYLPITRVIPALVGALICFGISFGIAHSRSLRGWRLGVTMAGSSTVGLIAGYGIGARCMGRGRPAVEHPGPNVPLDPDQQLAQPDLEAPAMNEVPVVVDGEPGPVSPQAALRLRPELGCPAIQDVLIRHMIQTFGTDLSDWEGTALHGDFKALIHNLKQIDEENASGASKKAVFECLLGLRDLERLHTDLRGRTANTPQVVNAYVAICCPEAVQGDIHQPTLTRVLTDLFQLSEEGNNIEDRSTTQALLKAMTHPAAIAIYDRLVDEYWT